MKPKLALISIVALLFLVLGGWSPAPEPSLGAAEQAQAVSPQPSNFSQSTVAPAFKPDLPVDYTMYDYLVYVLNDVHAYWSPIVTGEGHPEPAVTYSFPGPGEAVVTDCVLPKPDHPLQAFYCSMDDQIVITQKMALQLWNGTLKTNLDPPIEYAAGDFSVAFVVAHEYAHNLQAELGRLPGSNAAPKTAS